MSDADMSTDSLEDCNDLYIQSEDNLGDSSSASIGEHKCEESEKKS